MIWKELDIEEFKNSHDNITAYRFYAEDRSCHIFGKRYYRTLDNIHLEYNYNNELIKVEEGIDIWPLMELKGNIESICLARHFLDCERALTDGKTIMSKLLLYQKYPILKHLTFKGLNIFEHTIKKSKELYGNKIKEYNYKFILFSKREFTTHPFQRYIGGKYDLGKRHNFRKLKNYKNELLEDIRKKSRT